MRRLLIVVSLLALAGCEDEADLPDDPPLTVPGQTVPEAPPGMPAGMQPGMLPPGAAAQTDFAPALAVPGYATLPDPPPPPMPPGMQPGMQPGMPGQAGAPIALTPGFMPDPRVARGMAGGPVPAQSLDPSCLGHLAQQPNHVLQLGGAFPRLRVVVSSPQDTTLVIRAPDGSFRCVDDANGELNPIVDGPFAPGVYSVWVGHYQANAVAPYVIGFTELPQVTPAQLAQQ